MRSQGATSVPSAKLELEHEERGLVSKTRVWRQHQFSIQDERLHFDEGAVTHKLILRGGEEPPDGFATVNMYVMDCTGDG